MKKRTKIFLSLLTAIVLFVGSALLFMTGKVQFAVNSYGFNIISTVTLGKSEYQNNGSWWGYNQNKLASIGDTMFTFVYDNSNFANGNPSVSNPFNCSFIMIDQGIEKELGEAPCDRPCNVLTDTLNNLVYYFVNEPTQENPGNNGNTWIAKTVMYLYSFDPQNKECALLIKEDIIGEGSVGKIRAGADIDENGNIAFCYGMYDGYLKLHIYNKETGLWSETQTLTNNDSDSLMYAYVQIKDLNNIYVLCVQDTAKENETYYQYVKMFAYEGGSWRDYMVVDYRNHELAATNSFLVEHTEFKLIDGSLHIITRARRFKEVKHLVFKDGIFTELDTSLIANGNWIRLAAVNGKIYYVFSINSPYPTISVIDLESKKKVFSCFGNSFNSYLYLDRGKTMSDIRIITIPSGKGFIYDSSQTKIIVLQPKP